MAEWKFMVLVWDLCRKLMNFWFLDWPNDKGGVLCG